MKGLTLLAGTAIFLALAACSKSPGDTIYSATTAVMKPLFANLAPKDASHEVAWLIGLIGLIADKPECEVYKQALREAGKGPPATAALS